MTCAYCLICNFKQDGPTILMHMNSSVIPCEYLHPEQIEKRLTDRHNGVTF